MLICLLLGYAVGYGLGNITALNWSVEKAVYFLEIKGANISINSKEIVEGLWKYKNRIDSCYPQNLTA